MSAGRDWDAPPGCQFCARDPSWARSAAKMPAGTPSFPEGSYRVAAGCLRALHARVYLVCARHMDLFAGLHQCVPCPDCIMAPGEKISYLDQVLWRKEEDEEQVRQPGADRHRAAVPEARVLGRAGEQPGV